MSDASSVPRKNSPFLLLIPDVPKPDTCQVEPTSASVLVFASGIRDSFTAAGEYYKMTLVISSSLGLPTRYLALNRSGMASHYRKTILEPEGYLWNCGMQNPSAVAMCAGGRDIPVLFLGGSAAASNKLRKCLKTSYHKYCAVSLHGSYQSIATAHFDFHRRKVNKTVDRGRYISESDVTLRICSHISCICWWPWFRLVHTIPIGQHVRGAQLVVFTVPVGTAPSYLCLHPDEQNFGSETVGRETRRMH